MGKILLFCCLLVLSACAGGQGMSMAPYEYADANPHNFVLCHGFGCSSKTRVELTKAEWKAVSAPLRRKAKTAVAERQNIAKAIGLMEKHVTVASGLKADSGQARTFEKDQAQMDCIDEAINTTHYLEFFAAQDLFKFHRVHEPVHRGYFINGVYPHNSAAVEETMTGQVYVIDSYYFDAGTPASVVPLNVWLAEWRPEGLDQSKRR
jgi:hypothetical protein